MHKRSLNYSNNAGDKEPDCAVPEPFCFHFFSGKLGLEFWLYTEASFTGRKNRLWRNNYNLELLIRHIKWYLFRGKGRKVPLLGSSYGQRLLIDNFQQPNSIFFI